MQSNPNDYLHIDISYNCGAVGSPVVSFKNFFQIIEQIFFLITFDLFKSTQRGPEPGAEDFQCMIDGSIVLQCGMLCGVDDPVSEELFQSLFGSPA